MGVARLFRNFGSLVRVVFCLCGWLSFCFVCFAGFVLLCLGLQFRWFCLLCGCLVFFLFAAVFGFGWLRVACWFFGSLGLFLILFGCFLGLPFESLGLFSFVLVFFWVLAFGFAAAAFLSLLRLSLAGVFGVCTIPFGSFIACLYLLGVQQ